MYRPRSGVLMASSRTTKPNCSQPAEVTASPARAARTRDTPQPGWTGRVRRRCRSSCCVHAFGLVALVASHIGHDEVVGADDANTRMREKKRKSQLFSH